MSVDTVVLLLTRVIWDVAEQWCADAMGGQAEWADGQQMGGRGHYSQESCLSTPLHCPHTSLSWDKNRNSIRYLNWSRLSLWYSFIKVIVIITVLLADPWLVLSLLIKHYQYTTRRRIQCNTVRWQVKKCYQLCDDRSTIADNDEVCGHPTLGCFNHRTKWGEHVI